MTTGIGMGGMGPSYGAEYGVGSQYQPYGLCYFLNISEKYSDFPIFQCVSGFRVMGGKSKGSSLRGSGGTDYTKCPSLRRPDPLGATSPVACLDLFWGVICHAFALPPQCE